MAINSNEPLKAPEKSEVLLEFLKTRRSNLAKLMKDPGPTDEELVQILEIGARVPDHRKLAPWRFIVLAGESRYMLGGYIGAEFQLDHPDATEERAMFESQRLMRAPLIIAVVSSPVEDAKATPVWEQELSAGAVCYNLCLAAQSLGYGAQWLTEWYAYNEVIRKIMGVSDTEKIAGFVYIGNVDEAPAERPRPSLEDKVSFWVGE